MRHYYNQSLQQFQFKHKYDCIWTTWGLNFLNDTELKVFMKKCKSNLKSKRSLVFAKENTDVKNYVI